MIGEEDVEWERGTWIYNDTGIHFVTGTFGSIKLEMEYNPSNKKGLFTAKGRILNKLNLILY